MSASSVSDLLSKLNDLTKIIRKANKSRISLSSHSFYAPKARSQLAALRKSFLTLQRDYPKERFARVAFELLTIEPLLKKLVELFPSNYKQMLSLLQEVTFKVQSDLAAELDGLQATEYISSSAPFLPDDLIDRKHCVMQKILWEVNRSYNTACYNACAAMVRRLVETLIIEAFEQKGIGSKIKRSGEYMQLGSLIGKAVNEPVFQLTRNTKKLLPDLKFFGDLGVHNRMALVRKQDLDRLHNQIRVGLEELVRHL